MHNDTPNWYVVDQYDFTALRIVVRKLIGPVADLRQQWRRSRDRRGFEERWVDWGGRLSYSAFLVWLAGDVADQLIRDRPRSRLGDLLLLVDTADSCNQDAAERFLQRFFVCYPVIGTAAYRRTIRVFRHMIKRKIVLTRGGIESSRRSLV